MDRVMHVPWRGSNNLRSSSIKRIYLQAIGNNYKIQQECTHQKSILFLICEKQQISENR
jgi:hypothetical protein